MSVNSSGKGQGSTASNELTIPPQSHRELNNNDELSDGYLSNDNIYPAPDKKWVGGICNFATHVKVEIKSEEIKVNKFKASKKASRDKTSEQEILNLLTMFDSLCDLQRKLNIEINNFEAELHEISSWARSFEPLCVPSKTGGAN